MSIAEGGGRRTTRTPRVRDGSDGRAATPGGPLGRAAAYEGGSIARPGEGLAGQDRSSRAAHSGHLRPGP